MRFLDTNQVDSVATAAIVTLSFKCYIPNVNQTTTNNLLHPAYEAKTMKMAGKMAAANQTPNELILMHEVYIS